MGVPSEARLDQQLTHDVLGAPSLVGGNHMAVAVDVSNRSGQMFEVDGAGIGLIAAHHAGPLVVAHGIGARIGQQIDINVFASQ